MSQIVYSVNQINPVGGKRIIIVLIRIGSVDDPFIWELPPSNWLSSLKKKKKKKGGGKRGEKKKRKLVLDHV